MKNAILTIDRGIAGFERGLLIVLTALLTGLMCTQVILRYAFNKPIFWAEEVAVQLLVFMSFFGLSLLVHSRHLISVDIVLNHLGGTAKTLLIRAIDGGALFLIVFFAYYATIWIATPATRMELSPTTGLPKWYSYAALPIALYFMALHQLSALVRPISATEPNEGLEEL